VAWALAFAGFRYAQHLKVTPEKVLAYLHSIDFAHLTGPERAKALRKLAAMLNALTLEERRAARLDGSMAQWFAAMTDAEQGEFMEATMPTGFRQMLTAFEQMPEEKRRKAIEGSIRRMQEQREKLAKASPEERAEMEANAPAELKPELREKAVQLGLKTFYDTGSPQMKAELAPMLEEMQHSMESGRLFPQPRGPRPEKKL
jgi:hypothetical protein